MGWSSWGPWRKILFPSENPVTQIKHSLFLLNSFDFSFIQTFLKPCVLEIRSQENLVSEHPQGDRSANRKRQGVWSRGALNPIWAGMGEGVREGLLKGALQGLGLKQMGGERKRGGQYRKNEALQKPVALCTAHQPQN